MQLCSRQTDDRSSEHLLWLAIGEPGQPGQRHCGIEYRRADDSISFLHFAFHYILKDEPADDGDYRWAIVGLDTENQRVFAGFAAAISQMGPSIPYAFDAANIVFDPSGDLEHPEAGKGLTCATFITAFFKTYGLPLLDEETWTPRAEDEIWAERILEQLESFGASPEHVAAITTGGTKRFRPEEVVGSATIESEYWPVSNQTALQLAQQVLDELEAS